jgi:hypothetical protein
MNTLNISRSSFTNIFWKIIFSNGSSILDQAKLSVTSKNIHFEARRNSADYNTGSISVASAVSLALLTNYFRPSLIAEVGTFIGRSTYSLALGHGLCGIPSPEIHTCDYSNDIKLETDSILSNLVQYPKKSSTDMFSAVLDNKLTPDIYLLDGRLQENDFPLLIKLHAENAIFFLDDFEGMEKGVSNATALTNVFKDCFALAYPASDSFLSSYGLTDSSTTAVLIPFSKLRFVNQG